MLVTEVRFCPTCNKDTACLVNTDLGFIAECTECKGLVD